MFPSACATNIQNVERSAGDGDLDGHVSIIRACPVGDEILERERTLGRPQRRIVHATFNGPPDHEDRITGEVDDLSPLGGTRRQHGPERFVEDTGHLLRPDRPEAGKFFGQRCETGNIDEETDTFLPLHRRDGDRCRVCRQLPGHERWDIGSERLCECVAVRCHLSRPVCRRNLRLRDPAALMGRTAAGHLE